MRLTAASKKQLDRAIVVYGPKHPFLNRLVRYRALGFYLAVVMLLLYVLTAMVFVLTPYSYSIEKPVEALEESTLKKLIL